MDQPPPSRRRPPYSLTLCTLLPPLPKARLGVWPTCKRLSSSLLILAAVLAVTTSQPTLFSSPVPLAPSKKCPSARELPTRPL
nr:unnamed protein product [Spirometra erinaceieuropaei]